MYIFIQVAMLTIFQILILIIHILVKFLALNQNTQ